MEHLWGRLKEPHKVTLPPAQDLTKAAIRQRVWEFMEKNDIANFPRPVYSRIPNFKGANMAGVRVAELPEFQSARTIKVSPDKPQEEVRFQVLKHHKDLIVPTPGLKNGLFNRLLVEPGSNQERLRELASRQGIDSLSKSVPMASRLKLDLVVVGSVAVDLQGRRIGKGQGFSDLEWAMATSHHGAVSSDTLVITTVHDLQVLDPLPDHLFAAHDLPVDIIVTPTRLIRVANKLSKPSQIYWQLLSEERLNQIPILRDIRFREKKAGRAVHLQDCVIEAADEHRTQRQAVKPERSPDMATPSNSVGLFVGRIPKFARVKDLKGALGQRDVKVSNLVWKGSKGYAFVHLDPGGPAEPRSPDELCQKLKGVKIGGSVLNVELAVPRKANGHHSQSQKYQPEVTFKKRVKPSVPDLSHEYESVEEPSPPASAEQAELSKA